MIDAAVLIPVYRANDGELHIVMVLRKPGGVHGGQIAFPGGGAEPGDASADAELETALVKIVEQKAGGLLVVNDSFFNTRRRQLGQIVARHGLPAIYAYREYVTDGGLISYSTSLTETHRQLGYYTGRILKGEKPSDLPVVQPTKFELVVNLKTAKALGLSIPPSVLARADEVIE